MTDEKKEPTIKKVMKMIHEALFSPSPQDELYKPSELIPEMIFYYLIMVIVVIVVLSLVLKYFGFLWLEFGNQLLCKAKDDTEAWV